nr:hypothetical protein [Glaciibacter superstes]
MRALHHWDEIGLTRPARCANNETRSPNGSRTSSS